MIGGRMMAFNKYKNSTTNYKNGRKFGVRQMVNFCGIKLTIALWKIIFYCA